jgi:hypothetical protein
MHPAIAEELLRQREREIRRNIRFAWQNEPARKRRRTVRLLLPAILRTKERPTPPVPSC